MALSARSDKTIGILTSGGDCAGLNAAIRAVVSRAALGYGWRVIGIRQGTMGLLRRPVEYETLDLSVATGEILRLGGTILGTTNRGDPFAFPMADGSVQDRSAEVIEGVRQLALDALIGIGGDGSFAILRRLAQQGGIPLVGIPKTIDNDVRATENSVGFHTAVAVATEALDRLQPTAASHDRVMVLEVMGRDAGHIALAAGIAGGADVILIPEIGYTLESVAAHIEKVRRQGRNFALLVVAEAVKDRSGQPVQRRQPGGNRHLWRDRPQPRRGAGAADRGRDARHRAGPCPARQPADLERPPAGLSLRHACGRPRRRRQVRPHGRLAGSRRGRCPARRCHCRAATGRSRQYVGAYRTRTWYLSGR